MAKLRLIVLVLPAVGMLTGCVSESSGPDAVCQWRGDADTALDLSDPRQAAHLSKDAEEVEDISIRYGDGHARPTNAGSPTIAEYHAVRERCLTALFQAVAERHHVTPRQVRESIDQHRHTSLDAVVMLSFGLLYGFFVNRLVRGIWRRFPPARDRILGILATVAISPVVSVLGVAVGEMWANVAETWRIGYGHLVERVERIPWGHHRPAVFATGLVIFWLLAWLRYEEAARAEPVDHGVLKLFERLP